MKILNVNIRELNKMLEFKKYSSMNNHYGQKEISYWLSRYPELKDAEFEISEKSMERDFNV